MTGRRRFNALVLGGGLVVASRAGWAQTGQRVAVVGLLRPTAPSATEFMATGIPNALRQLGLVHGRNLVIEMRSADGQTERLPGLARELV
jgi:hypothetical protein